MDSTRKQVLKKLALVVFKIVGGSAVMVAALMFGWYTTHKSLGDHPIQFFLLSTAKFSAFLLVMEYLSAAYKSRRSPK